MLALPDGFVSISLGAVLALGVSALVLRPLVRGVPDEPVAPRPSGPTAEERASAVEALREIEFDRATGKLSESDYAVLKSTYTRQALAELRARDAAATVGASGGAAGLAVADGDDAVESALRAYRARAPRCPEHGARSQAGARFCSECGRFLVAACPRCGARCEREGQRFCADCGSFLAS